MKRITKHPEDMSLAELAKATKEFDRPYIFEEARPMTATEYAQECKLRRDTLRTAKGVKGRK